MPAKRCCKLAKLMPVHAPALVTQIVWEECVKALNLQPVKPFHKGVMPPL